MSEVMNEFRRLRIRNEGEAAPSLSMRPDDPPTLVGKVVTPANLIGVGKFLRVNPVAVLGAEVEGGAGTLTVDGATTIPVLLVGLSVPASGEFLICRYVQHRWVADRTSATGPATPILVGIPGCFCQGTPATLSISVSYGPGETAATYGGAYRNGSLTYFTTAAPSYLPQASYGGAGYYSTTAWVDNSGATNYYRLSCSSSQYALGLGQFSGGRWQAPGQIYTWSVGGKTPVNYCSPFLLSVGRTQPGIYFNGNFTVSG